MHVETPWNTVSLFSRTKCTQAHRLNMHAVYTVVHVVMNAKI